MWTSSLLHGFLALVVSGVSYTLVVGIYRLTLHPLARYPGPFLARVSSAYAAYQSYSGEIHVDIFRCHERYGDVVRYGPNRLLFRTDTALHDIYGFGKNTQKSAAYHQFPTKFAYSTHNAVDKAMHRRKRKLVNQAFTPSSLQIWESAAIRQVNVFCQELVQSSIPGLPEKKMEKWSQPKKMSDYCLYLMTDIVSDAVFGQSLCTLTTTENRFMTDLVHKSYEWIGIIFQAPKISSFGLDVYLFPDLCRARQKLRDLFRSIVMRRMSREASLNDIYGVYMGYRDPVTSESFPVSELGAEALLLFGAGPDATSTSLASAFFYIARNQTVYQRVLSEVRGKFGDVSEIVPGPTLTSCDYLRACLYEAMRMNPVNGGALWREVLGEGFTLDGRPIPKGVDVGVGVYSIHHQSKYFPDPFSFKPERWIVEGEFSEEDVKAALSAWTPFSIGPRGCVGKAVAITQLMLAMGRVLFQLDMRTPEDRTLACMGEGVAGAKFPRNLTSEFQAKGTFSSILHGPMLQFKEKDS